MSTAEKIKSYLSEIGCEFPNVGLLQSADPFLDSAGEDLRRRIFITQENSGNLYCLRPEFTIPIALTHMQSGKGQAQYGCLGSVFRQRQNADHEFQQAGFEDIGDTDRSGADVRCITHALSLLGRMNIVNTDLVVGNQWIFKTVLENLEVPLAWQKKLIRAFGDHDLLAKTLESLQSGNSFPADKLPDAVTAALNKGDDGELEAAIAEQMLSAGLPLTGSRTPAAIAERVKEQSELASSCLDDEKRALLDQHLSIECPLSSAPDKIADFAKSAGIDLSIASDSLSQLSSGLGEHSASFDAQFGRRIDYYSGMVFEIKAPTADRPMIGGGRYDQLLTVLGSDTEVPAVGFAVWIDRLEGAS